MSLFVYLCLDIHIQLFCIYFHFCTKLKKNPVPSEGHKSSPLNPIEKKVQHTMAQWHMSLLHPLPSDIVFNYQRSSSTRAQISACCDPVSCKFFCFIICFPFLLSLTLIAIVLGLPFHLLFSLFDSNPSERADIVFV